MTGSALSESRLRDRRKGEGARVLGVFSTFFARDPFGSHLAEAPIHEP